MNSYTVSLCLAVLLASAPVTSFSADATPRQILAQGSSVHKLVFDLSAANPVPGQVHPGLLAVARLDDLYCDQGAKPEDVHIVVVLHAAATEMVRDPVNAAAMQKLAHDGVLFIVSQQSLALRHIVETALPSFMAVGPSADLVFFNFEESGYIYSGTGSLFKD